MTKPELAFLRDLRKVMREHKVELIHADATDDFVFLDSAGSFEIEIEVNDQLVEELKDQGGTRDEV